MLMVNQYNYCAFIFYHKLFLLPFQKRRHKLIIVLESLRKQKTHPGVEIFFWLALEIMKCVLSGVFDKNVFT